MLEKPGISLKRHASVDFGERDAMHSVLVPSVSIHTRTASGSIADHLKTSSPSKNQRWESKLCLTCREDSRI
jgi:hypothetical protein